MKLYYIFIGKLLFSSMLILLVTESFAQPSLTVDSLVKIVESAQQNANPTKMDIKAAIVLADYYSKVSMDTAKYYGLVAYDFSERIGSKVGIAMSLNSIGMAYQICGYFDSAVPYHDSSMAIFVSVGDTTGLVFVRNNMAVALMRRGNYSEALKFYQENLLIAENRNEPENMILAYNNMGITYFDWKKYKQALDNYHMALEVLNNLGEEERTGPVFNNIGEAYFGIGKMDTALLYFNKARIINQKFGKKRSISISMTNIGNIYFDNNDYENALNNYSRALSISESIPDEVHMALINIKIGILYNALREYKKAYGFLEKGLTMSLDQESFNSVLEAYMGLIEYARGIKDAQQVYNYGNLYINLKDSLFNDNSLNKISELETKFKTVEKEKEIVILKSDQQVKEMEIQLQKNLKYSLIVLMMVLLLTAILLFNRYKLKKDKEKSEVEKARMRIEQRLLHSQMNPHFIFNSLNSINSFIGENNTQEAQTYLSKFARLMRLILENSRKNMVALEDEVNALRLNLELEQLRFDGRFNFEIDISKDIDTDDIYLPPMLIQPFIENAIMHGVKGIHGEGFISLTIKVKDELLICIVEDNGIGRDESMRKGNKKEGHVSLGTQVTIERLEILQQEINTKSGMEIIDLKDKNGIGIGTKVVLSIPFEED